MHGNTVLSWSTVHMEKPTATSGLASQINEQSSSHVIITQIQHTRSSSNQTSLHAYASKQNVSLPWRRSRRPCELGYDRPTNQQTTRHSAAHHGKSFSQCSQHQQEAPRCLDNFPLQPTGAAEACAGPESCCGSAAPTASPRTLFSLKRSVTAHKRPV